MGRSTIRADKTTVQSAWQGLFAGLGKRQVLLLSCLVLAASTISASSAEISGSSEDPNDLRRNALATYMEKRTIDPPNAFNSALGCYKLAIQRASEKSLGQNRHMLLTSTLKLGCWPWKTIRTTMLTSSSVRR